VANIKSQMKRIRTNEAARKRNQSVKSALRTAIRSFREAAEAPEPGRQQEVRARAGLQQALMRRSPRRDHVIL